MLTWKVWHRTRRDEDLCLLEKMVQETNLAEEGPIDDSGEFEDVELELVRASK